MKSCFFSKNFTTNNSCLLQYLFVLLYKYYRTFKIKQSKVDNFLEIVTVAPNFQLISWKKISRYFHFDICIVLRLSKYIYINYSTCSAFLLHFNLHLRAIYLCDKIDLSRCGNSFIRSRGQSKRIRKSVLQSRDAGLVISVVIDLLSNDRA